MYVPHLLNILVTWRGELFVHFIAVNFGAKMTATLLSLLLFFLQVMRTGNSQRPLTPGQGQQSQQESLAAAAAANPALAYAGMSGE